MNVSPKAYHKCGIAQMDGCVSLMMCNLVSIVIAGMAGLRKARRPAEVPVSTVAVGSFQREFEGWGTARTRPTLLFSLDQHP
jgi:hypothetical protein